MHIVESKTKNRTTGAVYVKHKLVESVRLPEGSRKRNIMCLGRLDLTKIELKSLSMILEARIRSRQSLFEDDGKLSEHADAIMAKLDFEKLREIEQEQREADLHRSELTPVYLDQTQVSESRSLGPELVAHHMWQTLHIPDILSSCGLDAGQAALAEAVVLARLIEPGSELQCMQWIRERSAVAELVGKAVEETSKNKLYGIADLLLLHKTAIESELRMVEGQLFGDNQTLFLYDLTNTYLEGNALKNDLAKRGKSKEKRTDCPLITLALLVDQKGFPVFSQIYAGNQSECETLEDILDRLQSDISPLLLGAKPIMVMDRGIATAANIKLLKDREYSFVVVERRKVNQEYTQQFEQSKKLFERIRDDADSAVYVRKEDIETGARVLVFSEGKQAKEEAMDALKEERMIKDLTKLKQSVDKRTIVKESKISMRIGRIMERYPSVARYYEIQPVIDEDTGEVKDLIWPRKESREARSVLTGTYVIETTEAGLSAGEIFDLYHTLTRVEYAFRCLKTDLGMRPIYHQTAARTSAHLFISVLAYHLLIAMETKLREQNDSRKWLTIRKQLSTHMRTTVMLKGEQNKVHYIRVSGQPEEGHRDIYQKLGVKDPLKMRQITL